MIRWPPLASLLVLTLMMHASTAWAHAFPERAEPGAGALLGRAPKVVRIRFDRAIEPAFFFLRVEDAHGVRVDANDARLQHGRNDTLIVTLRTLLPGRYRVFWSVVARDGHRTRGDYEFIVSGPTP